MPKDVKVRFAPSPTGRLHVGNARVAVLNWLFARRQRGEVLLRMDDTDRERSTKEFEAAIIEDLRWLGIDWDDFVRQSARQTRYDAAVERLKKAGRLYPCFETSEELDLKRKIQLGRGRPPVYDRAALDLSSEEQTALMAEGRTPHWRFKLLDQPIEWTDLGRGPVRFEAGHLSDPVLVREDGRPLYTLSSVVDDGEFFISHVIRGEDHVANTAVQIELFRALGYDVPDFAHLPLMVGADGKQLSKRLGSLSLGDLKEKGVEPQALTAYLARLGTATAPEGDDTLDGLVPGFDLAAFGRAAPRYDEGELSHLNAKVLHRLPYSAVAERLAAMGLDGADEAFWLAVRENCERLWDAGHWWRVCHGTIEPAAAPEDADFLAEAARLLPEEPWDADTYAAWIERVKAGTGRKGKGLFMPLRLALTARPKGPELGTLLPLMGRKRALERLAPGG
ncbi:glutamate--tRNA ligase [Marivibrio halodurans]|uniref:Glutamate--tRNA ligase n=1 Tax=Marivibrio halodurans TaxID=2039722 RepID=A0A8J7S5B7_9PROT|nr:glutamate--tRNA ligase [Marivibrio halodurans]MBP5857049.1 glutamate--tRNA ligase [Marivibrio halodurans]